MVGSLADDLLKIALRGADDATGTLTRILADPAHADTVMTALRSGDPDAVASAIRATGTEGAEAFLRSPPSSYTRLMGQLGPDLVGRMDEVATVIRTGSPEDGIQAYRRILGNDAVTEGTERLIREAAEQWADVGSAGLRAIAAGADDTLETGADIARNVGPRLSNGEVRFLRTDRVLTYTGRAAAVTVIGAAIIEVESGGALSQMTLEGLIDAVEYAREHDLPFVEDLAQSAFEGIAQVHEWMHAGRTTAHNSAIMLALGDPDEAGPDDIANARRTAISWQITDPMGIAADAYLISQRIRLENPEMTQDDRDVLVADALIDRMVENANLSALSTLGESVTREDVEAYMREHAHQIAELPTEMARIKTALVAAVPGLDTAVASAEAEAPAPGTFGRVYTALTDETPMEEIRAMFAAASSNIGDLNLGVGQRIGFEVLSGISGLLAGLGAVVSIFNEAAGERLMTMAANMERTALTATGVDERMAALSRDATAGEVVADGGDPFEVTETGGPDPALTVPAHG